MTPVPEFSRHLAAEKITSGGVDRTVVATPAECAALAERFGVPAVMSLACAFSLRRGEDTTRGEIVADGKLSATVARVCVVSMEEFEQSMSERFRVRLVLSGTERDDTDPEEDDEIPYDGMMIDLGEVAAEQAALDLDPYPRAPGVDFLDVVLDDPGSPFAVLRGRAAN